MKKDKQQGVYVVLAGALTLTVAMGIGRFAYTPIFPLMQAATFFSEAYAGYLASINYLGYLLGAFFGGLINWKDRKAVYLKLYLLVNILSTMLMAVSSQMGIWMFLRFVSGLTSGLCFVLVSSIVLDYLAKNQRLPWSGFFYSGVGFGIVLTGLLVPVFAHFFSWQGAWLGVGLLALLFSLYIFRWVEVAADGTSFQQLKSGRTKDIHHGSILIWLILAYGCEGLGYIITGTFLVAMVEQAVGLPHVSAFSWVLVGLAAFPSCLLWAKLGERWGNLFTLKITYIVQAVGITLPVLTSNAYVTFVGAILFGGTFMGITILTLSVARELFPQQSSKVIGYLTAVYGIGQIIGPAVAGVMVARTGDYTLAILFATAVLFIGIGFLLAASRRRGKGNATLST